MTGRAGGPDRPSGSGRPPESASFETARVGSSRGARPPLLAVAFIVVLGTVVAVGISGRLTPGPFPVAAENQALAASPTATVAPPALPTPPAGGRPLFPADTGPIYTSPPGKMVVQAKRHPQTIFVHGDVDAARITWVYVGVLDDEGRVAGWTSVSLPGAAGPNKFGGPTMRFDVELAIPVDFQGRLWVRAQAYDSSGKVVASTNVEIPAAPSSS
jgi:hypothetical protein